MSLHATELLRQLSLWMCVVVMVVVCVVCSVCVVCCVCSVFCAVCLDCVFLLSFLLLCGVVWSSTVRIQTPTIDNTSVGPQKTPTIGGPFASSTEAFNSSCASIRGAEKSQLWRAEHFHSDPWWSVRCTHGAPRRRGRGRKRE